MTGWGGCSGPRWRAARGHVRHSHMRRRPGGSLQLRSPQQLRVRGEGRGRQPFNRQGRQGSKRHLLAPDSECECWTRTSHQPSHGSQRGLMPLTARVTGAAGRSTPVASAVAAHPVPGLRSLAALAPSPPVRPSSAAPAVPLAGVAARRREDTRGLPAAWPNQACGRPETPPSDFGFPAEPLARGSAAFCCYDWAAAWWSGQLTVCTAPRPPSGNLAPNVSASRLVSAVALSGPADRSQGMFRKQVPRGRLRGPIPVRGPGGDPRQGIVHHVPDGAERAGLLTRPVHPGAGDPAIQGAAR